MFRLLLVCLWLAMPARADVQPGLAHIQEHKQLLAGKLVGLVVNQASLFRGQHAIDLLLAQGIRVVKLYALEHGVRGEGGAGEEIGDGVDPVSGLPIISLYGAKKKPDARALDGVDVVVFDVQDVGVRMFTYISSLGLIMEAAAEFHKPVVVLDRPNPNGDYVEGPLLDLRFKSFVGAYPIPLVYGLTIGELARMIHGEGWQKTAGLVLHVVPLSGYRRGLVVAPEARPSPGLRTLNAIRIYPSLVLFEPTIISVGRGTEHPFTQFGIPEERIGAHTFTPRFAPEAKNKVYDGLLCYGEEYFSRAVGGVPHFTTDIFSSALARVQRRPFVTDERFLRLLVGDETVVRGMLAGVTFEKLRKGFAHAVAEFIRRKKKYELYQD